MRIIALAVGPRLHVSISTVRIMRFNKSYNMVFGLELSRKHLGLDQGPPSGYVAEEKIKFDNSLLVGNGANLGTSQVLCKRFGQVKFYTCVKGGERNRLPTAMAPPEVLDMLN